MQKPHPRATALLLSLLFLLTALPLPTAAEATATPTPAFTPNCKSAVLMEASTGKILYAHNPAEAMPPASVTKIMTLLLVMECMDTGTLHWEDTVTASARAASMGGSQIFLKEGEQMTARDLIKSVVIASANDAAVALAEHTYGSEEAFVKRMNQRAAELGMTKNLLVLGHCESEQYGMEYLARWLHEQLPSLETSFLPTAPTYQY